MEGQFVGGSGGGLFKGDRTQAAGGICHFMISITVDQMAVTLC